MKSGITLIMMLLFAVQCFAAQPSFDCSKATRFVEKIICADKDLAQLDVELATAYKQALQQAEDPVRLKQQQLNWLKQRNTHINRSDVLASYKSRIYELTSMEDKEGQLAPINEIKPSSHYDAWHRYVPQRQGGNVYQHDDDYFLSYNNNINNTTGFYFFKGKQLLSVDKDFYAKVRELKSQLSITLQSGLKISWKNRDPRQPRRCPQALNVYYEFVDSQGIKTEKSVLYILDQPLITKVSNRCVDAAGETITEYVVSLGGANTS